MGEYNGVFTTLMLYLLKVCDFDGGLAAEVFADAAENLNLYGKRLTKEDGYAVVKFVENIIKENC